MKKHFPLMILVLVNLIVGLFALPGFGKSSDELAQHLYAERTILVIKSFLTGERLPAGSKEETPQQGSHGPAFTVAVVLLRNLFLPAGTPLEKLYFNHFVYFIMFLVGVVSLYFLARRWVSELAALGTALLFNTQPLLLGHAFINPKDTVFMSLMIASMVLGLWMVDRHGKSNQETGRPLLDGIRSFFGQFLRVDVWLAGLTLGFASAIRLIAPLIGLVVLGYILIHRKWEALPKFVAYGLIAFFSMILFWPYLWPDPFGRLISSIGSSANYPDLHVTLFNGVLVTSTNVPRSYVPVLLAVQLTETTLLLLLVGAFSLLRKPRWDLIVLLLIWSILPIVAVLGLDVHLYNNFRQLFFLLPPLFLLAGLGLDWLLRLVRRPSLRFLILALVLLPGMYANITLYPYQYVYYNQLAGGLRGAYRVFDLDYWNLAFREGQDYINQNAGANANIFVLDSKPSAQTFARPDLIFNALGSRKKDMESYDYIIVSTAQNEDVAYSRFPTVFVVERGGVPLVYVKKPK